jgi:hypothetical protein
MMYESNDTTAAVRDLDRLMLEVKFRIPPLHPSTVRRARLVEQVRVKGCRVVGVTAPAGYGKSTFLAEWARIEDRRVAWLSLDRFDDDPGTFLGPSAAAYGHIDSDRADLVEGGPGDRHPRTQPSCAASGRSLCRQPGLVDLARAVMAENRVQDDNQSAAFKCSLSTGASETRRRSSPNRNSRNEAW